MSFYVSRDTCRLPEDEHLDEHGHNAVHNGWADDWEADNHTGICLNLTDSDHGLKCNNTGDKDDHRFRVTMCKATYDLVTQRIFHTTTEKGHPVSQSSPWIILCVLSVLLNIYFLVRIWYKNKDKKAKKSRSESQNGSVTSPEPSRNRENIESVESIPNVQELKQCDVESVGKNEATKNEEDKTQ